MIQFGYFYFRQGLVVACLLFINIFEGICIWGGGSLPIDIIMINYLPEPGALTL